jgi:hypothetical protein
VNDRSAQLAQAVADRLLDPARIRAAAATTSHRALATAFAGTALLHARLAATSPSAQDAALRHWAEAAAHARQRAAGSAGIFHSRGALAASIIIGSQYLPDLAAHASVGRATRWLSARALTLAVRLRQRCDSGVPGTPWALYDVISGLSGTGRVLLAAAAAGYGGAEPGLAAALDALTAMILTPGRRPGWWAPVAAGQPATRSPGAAATGVAHGVAGPLALLASASRVGWSVRGQPAAIRAAASWLLRWRDATTWPPHVTGEEAVGQPASPVPGRRDAWCYGSPGISRALLLAAQSGGGQEAADAATSALSGLAARPSRDWDTDGPTICHGYAGVLACTSGVHAGIADAAAAAIADAFTPRLPFGFCHHDPDGTPRSEPGLLTGAAGIALALADHAALPALEVPARWDCLLLLS